MRRSLTAAVALLLVSACSPDLNWREWRTHDVGLSQLFPCKPVRQQRRVELAGRSLPVVLQVCDVGDVSWALAYADVGDPGAVGASLNALVIAAHANIGSSVAERAPMMVPGATPQPASGRFRFRGRAPDGRVVDEALLVFAKGTVVVQVTALGARLPDEAVDAFFGSVRAGP